MEVLQPAPGVYAFYDGRGARRWSAEPNWVDAGALALGIASYAILDGDEALVYDTHVSVEDAMIVRRTLETLGVRRFTVVLSHWHLDHIAGAAAFADCEVIAHERTAVVLERDRAAIEAGELEGPPAIRPLVLPTRTFADRLTLTVGALEVELHHVEIHSEDATVIWWPARELLLAGDTLEDTVTYVSEPDRLDAHLAGLERLRALGATTILPNHGAAGRIAADGYDVGLIDATADYTRLMLRAPADAAIAATPLRELLAAPLAAGAITYFAPYEAVHAANLAAVGAARA